ncbi:MAG: Occludin/ELL family protein [Cyanobacteriota bacterium]
MAAVLPLLAGPLAAQTGPVLCTTTLEAPLVVPGQPLPERAGPREVTRCGVIGTVSDLVRQRYFTYRAPFARGVDVAHQITDLFGLAMAGRSGNQIMGAGFPDQAIIWDGSAIETTNSFLMDQQVQLVPSRTADLPSPYTTSVRTEVNTRGPYPSQAYPDDASALR